jgi:Uma2 family endonuclease
MTLDRTHVTAEDFDRFVAQPENAGRLFEHIKGEIIEVSPGRTLISEIVHILTFAVRLFCRDNNIPCHTSGEGGAYRVAGHTIAPDFAYKPTHMSNAYADPVPPLWAVEIISPTDKADDIRDKREINRKAGILLAEVYPKSHSIDVYSPGRDDGRTLGINDILDGGDVLPNFKIAVRELFPEGE